MPFIFGAVALHCARRVATYHHTLVDRPPVKSMQGEHFLVHGWLLLTMAGARSVLLVKRERKTSSAWPMRYIASLVYRDVMRDRYSMIASPCRRAYVWARHRWQFFLLPTPGGAWHRTERVSCSASKTWRFFSSFLSVCNVTFSLEDMCFSRRILFVCRKRLDAPVSVFASVVRSPL